MEAEKDIARHCEGGTTEAIPLSGVAKEFGCSIAGLLRATAASFASARNDVRTLILSTRHWLIDESIIDN